MTVENGIESVIQDARSQYIGFKAPSRRPPPARMGLTVGKKVVQLPITIQGHPAERDSYSVSVSEPIPMRTFDVRFRDPGAFSMAIQYVPTKYLSSGQYMRKTIPAEEVGPFDPVKRWNMRVAAADEGPSEMIRHLSTLESRYGVRGIQKLRESRPGAVEMFSVPTYVRGSLREARYGRHRIREDDLGIAATTPILGQYVPTFGWPDDWGWYWEYLDMRLFVPEASFAAKMKTRMVWKDGYDIDCESSERKKTIENNIRKSHIIPRLIGGTHVAMCWGNSYQEIVGNSRAVWGAGSSEMDYALSASGIIYGLPRPLLKYTPTTVFKGLKSLDPRAVRIEIHPQEFDLANGDVYRSKYIQRRWAGPLAPTVAYPQSQQVELDFHPDQIFCMQFNRLPDGIYGYSIYRETLYAAKGYLLMLQFLPMIVQKRADPLLHFKFGGNVKLPTGVEVTSVPSDDEVEMEKERFVNRAPGEDVFTNVNAEVLEVYKGGARSEDLIDFIHEYRDRCFLGWGIPLSIGANEAGQQIKWGTMKYEISEDEIRIDYQMPIEEEFNRKLMPLLGGRDGDRFVFPEISEEDQRADEAWLADMFTRGMISRQYAVSHMRLPKEALKGDFIYDVMASQMQQMQQMQIKPGGQGGSAAGKDSPDAGKAGSLSPGPGKEKWRVRDTSDGYIMESFRE